MSTPSHTVDGGDVAAAAMDGVGVVEGSEYASASERLAEIHGCRADRLVGREWADLYDDVEGEPTAERLLGLVRPEGTWRGSARARVVEAGTVPVELSLRATDRGVVCAVRDVADRRARERRLRQYERLAEAAEDGLYVLDENLAMTGVNEACCRLLGVCRGELLGVSLRNVLAGENWRRLADAVRARTIEGDDTTVRATVETGDGRTRRLETRVRPSPGPGGQFCGGVGVLRDVTERPNGTGAPDRLRAEPAGLDRIDELLFDVVRELFEAPPPDLGDVREAVCERLADSDLYRFAWVGRPEAGGDRIVPQASAGLDADDVAGVTAPTDGSGPGGRAFATGEIQVSHDVRADPSFEPWREAAVDRNVRSAAAVPLSYDETVYGILAVYATRPTAFAERERRHLAVLGEAIGFVINAVKTRQLLYAEAVSELTFELPATRFPLGAVAAGLDATLSLDGYVETGDGEWLLYLAVADADAAAVVAALNDDERVGTARVVHAVDSGGEVGVVTDSALLDTVAAAGGNVHAAEFASAGGRLIIDVPRSSDVRRVVEQVRSTYPGASLVARTDRERPVSDPASLANLPAPDLTERQRQALEAAYHAGYFEWPRESTAEDVADLLGIAAPTLHAHLRKAEAELVSVFLRRPVAGSAD